MKNLLTAKQALELCDGKISKATLYRFAKDKTIITQKKSGRLFFDKESLEEVLSGMDVSETVSKPSHETKSETPFSERMIVGIRHEAFEHGKKEGQLLLMKEKEKITEENYELKQKTSVLNLEKKHLEELLKSEKIQKIIVLIFLVFWIAGWTLFSFRKEIITFFSG